MNLRTIRERFGAQRRRVVCAAMAMVAGGLGLAPVAVAGEEGSGSFIRSQACESGMRSTLEAAVRAYRPAGDRGPTVFLVAAVHIGDASYYNELQTFLDAQDVVLFEGVRAPRSGEDSRWSAETDDQQRAMVSERRAALLSRWIQRHRRAHGELPGTLGAIDVPSEMLQPALIDAWGNPFLYGVVDEGEAPAAWVMSLGADGSLGGEGVDADIVVSPDFTKRWEAPTRRAQGIQQELADALGLSFQGSVMHHDAPNWRNSDVSMDVIAERFREVEADRSGEAFLNIMSGGGLSGRMATVAVRLIGASPRMREVFKAMIVETLADAERAMAAQPAAMQRMMQVILHDRDEVVLNDIGRVLEESGRYGSIAVIYGAAHLPGVEKGLKERYGYKPVATKWIPAIRVDLEAAGFSEREAQMMLRTMRSSLERQLRRGERGG
ncbi:MAG: type II secretion system protein GspG [Phycisphaerales bacterium]|nr:type II secretion system protein GspG [Phycisphaerales bacterium]